MEAPGGGQTAHPGTKTAAEWLGDSELRTLVAGIAKRHGLPGQDADDILQETLIAVLRVGHDVRVCKSWICKVAACKAEVARRKSASQSVHDQAFARHVADPENPENPSEIS